jgi:sugar/nucleoside kinase (ribokinase family)
MSIGGATYDLFVQVDHETGTMPDGRAAFTLPLGDKVPVKEVVETCGGGACNTSVGLSRLGCNASFEGIVGSDQWGERLLETMRNEGTDVRYATIVEGEVSSFSLILLAKNGERVILYEPGTNEHLHKANFDREIAGQADWVYLNHIQENSSMIQDDIVGLLTQDESPRLTWNPGGYQITEGIDSPTNLRLLKYTDVLLLNDEEALKFARADSIDQALRILLKTGAKSVCITEGKNGVTAADHTNRYHCPTLPGVKVVDTTGAGDAFGTGVSWALLQSMDFPIALKAGTMNAASVVGAIGAQKGLLTEIQMKDSLKRNDLPVDVRPL